MNKKTALFNAHNELGAKLVEFAGYDMPIQYKDGIMKEHLWVRDNAGIFDVSHMGQAFVTGENSKELLSKITPSVFEKTPQFKAKYTILLNKEGGIVDDLIITKLDDDKFFLVYNAGCKDKDNAWIRENLPENVEFTTLDDRSLVAVQGPKAETVVGKVLPGNGLDEQEYMTWRKVNWQGEDLFISRLGYTGEDGYEISIPDSVAEKFWNEVLSNEEAKPIGLGARDSLRLEAGYPLYGHDIDDSTSPIEADLSWVVSKVSQSYYGFDRISQERDNGVSKKRVGVKLLEKGVAREGADILNSDGDKIGSLTSGGFSPICECSIGQGYVDADYIAYGTEVFVSVRGRSIKAEIHNPSFIEVKTKTKKVK